MTAPQRFPNDEHLALAFDAGRLGLWSWNALTDEITWNDAMQTRFGLVAEPSARCRSTTTWRSSTPTTAS